MDSNLCRTVLFTDQYDDDILYWSNVDGWVDFDSATRFDISELSGLRYPLSTSGILFV